MKTTLKSIMLCGLIALTSQLFSQDVGINIVSQENGVNDGEWVVGAPNCTILIEISNNDGGSTLVPQYKLRPLLSVPSQIVTIAPNVLQTLPPGWTILSNNGSSIRLSNGTDQIEPGDKRGIQILMIPTNAGPLQTFTSTMAFSNGVFPGDVGIGATQTVGNVTGNDNSTTSAEVSSILPISLLSFNAIKEGKNGKLTWVTASEQNVSHFDVDYSKDGVSWSKVGTVKAAGNTSTNTSYTFTHQQGLSNGSNLYRIKSVDNDSKSKNSNVVNLALSGNDILNSISVFPNPAKGFTNLTYTNDYRGKAQIVITDATGKRVNTLQTVVNAGINTMKISTQSLSAGTYIITLYGEDGAKLGQPQRLMVNN